MMIFSQSIFDLPDWQKRKKMSCFFWFFEGIQRD